MYKAHHDSTLPHTFFYIWSCDVPGSLKATVARNVIRNVLRNVIRAVILHSLMYKPDSTAHVTIM